MGGLLSSFNNVDDVHRHFDELIKSASKTTGHQTLIVPQLTSTDGIYDIADSSEGTVCTHCEIMRAIYKNKPCGHAALCRGCLEQLIRSSSEHLGICKCMRKVEEIEQILTH